MEGGPYCDYNTTLSSQIVDVIHLTRRMLHFLPIMLCESFVLLLLMDSRDRAIWIALLVSIFLHTRTTNFCFSLLIFIVLGVCRIHSHHMQEQQLFNAAGGGRISEVRRLVGAGANVNWANPKWVSA